MIEKIFQQWGVSVLENVVRSKEQLAKAKEIIEKLLDNLTAIDGEQIRELKVVREAEQFLKELENEKRL